MTAVAARQGSQAPVDSTPPESPEHYRDLAFAESYAKAAAQQGGLPSVSWQRGSIGYLQGRYELVQVVSPSSALMGKLDSYDLVDERFLLEGIGTGGLTDGAHLDLRSQLVVCNGTTSYITVLGAQATVFSFETVEPTVLILAAQHERTRTEADLARLAESPIGKAVQAQRNLRMYEAGAKQSEWAAAQAAAARAEMEALPAASDEDMASFDREKQALQDRLEHIRGMVSWLKFK